MPIRTPPTERPGAAHATDRYGRVLSALLVLFLLTAFAGEAMPYRIALGVLSAFVLFATYRAAGITPARLRFLVLGVVATSIALAAAAASDDRTVVGISVLVMAAMVGGGPVVLVRRIFERPAVTLSEIAAALAAYVQVAFAFSFLYRGVALLIETPFFTSGTTAAGADFLYFSVVTITTLGYGDLAPATAAGRSLVMVETLVGQIFLVVLVARLVSQLGARRREPDSDEPA